MSDTELKTLAAELAPHLARELAAHGAAPRLPAAEPIPHKLTVAQFAWCVQRSAYSINAATRVDPKLKKHVQGKCPKLIHPAALALYGVDPAHAALRLAQWPHKSAA